jgi:hypothetical protein
MQIGQLARAAGAGGGILLKEQTFAQSPHAVNGCNVQLTDELSVFACMCT